jgi:hypothetical protein
MGFPAAGDEVYYNEAGEPTGWGKPETAESQYCDVHGFAHSRTCAEIDEESAADEEYDAPDEDYDLGPEVDDEGGMSEYRHTDGTVTWNREDYM